MFYNVFHFHFLFQAEKSGTVMFAEEMLELSEENADKRGDEGDDVLAEFSGIKHTFELNCSYLKKIFTDEL